MRSTAVFAVTLSAVLSGCASGRGHKSACEDSATAVGRAVEYLLARDNAGDLEGVLQGYADDVVWLPPQGEPVSGKRAVRERYEQLFSVYEVQLASAVVEIEVGTAWSHAWGYTTGVLTPRAGGDRVEVDDKFIALVRCEGSTWRVARLMWSPRTLR
jgi:ketosteroid isomerase-like protein